MPVRLYVGNLPKEPIERQALQEVFVDAGDTVSTKVIKDRKTGKCRGFAFVTVPTDELADEFIEKYNGQSFMDSPLKIEKALPRAKGKDKGEEGEPTFATDAPDSQTEAAPVKPSPSSPSKAKSNKKRPRGQKEERVSSSSDSFQPDPRWAHELAKLKEMLAASSN